MLRVVGNLFGHWTSGAKTGVCGPACATGSAPHADDLAYGTLTVSLFGYFKDTPAPAIAAGIPLPIAVPAASPSLLAARLRCTAKLNGKSTRLRLRRAAKAKPASAKRAPQLYPVKLKKKTAKRAKTKIIQPRPKLKSAIILRFPTRVARAPSRRHRPAA